MEIITAIPYWTIILFMQFTPLNEVETGKKAFYKISNENTKFSIEVSHIDMSNLDAMMWDFTTTLTPEADDIKKEEIKTRLDFTTSEGMYISKFDQAGNSFLNNRTMKIPKGSERIIIDLNESHILNRVDYTDSKVVLDKDTFTCKKSVYTKDNLTVEVYHDEMFGMLKAVVNNSGVKAEIIRVKK